MAQAKRAKPIGVKKPRDFARAHAIERAMIQIALVIVLAAGSALGLHVLWRYVDRQVVFPSAPPRVVLKDRPAWMSDFLAEEIARIARPAGTHSAFDHQLLVDVTHLLQASPWIRHVNGVRRAFGNSSADTLEIDCEYRAPVALVHWQDYFWLVDGEGVKLPEQFTAQQVPRIVLGRDRKMNIRIIDGVRNPPVQSGQKWPSDDLAAGLEMVKLLYGQPYAEDIVKVDVSNFAGRVDLKEPQLVLGTKYDTQIRWGRPVNSKDFFVEIPTARKLDLLRRVYEEYGRADGRQQWIDVRFDKITKPSESSQANSGH
jgi:hypothetical protein